MCWDVNYVVSPIYFMKKVGAFVVLKISVHLGFEHSFSTRNVLNEFGSFRSPNWACDNFLKILICLVCFPKL